SRVKRLLGGRSIQLVRHESRRLGSIQIGLAFGPTLRKGLDVTDLLALFAGWSRTRGYGPRDRMPGSGRNLRFFAFVTGCEVLWMSAWPTTTEMTLQWRQNG